MTWQIKELEKRFVNRNYILSEIIGNMVTHYVFHEENRFNYPMNTEISLNWCRGFYHNVYEPNEKYITEERFRQIAATCLAGHNMAAKGIIPSMTLAEFMEEMKKPVEHLPNEETCGATPAGYIPPITSPDWPVEIKDYFDMVEPPIDIDSNTNHSRYGGMKKAIGVELNEDDYDMEYDGSKEAEEKRKANAPTNELINEPIYINRGPTIDVTLTEEEKELLKPMFSDPFEEPHLMDCESCGKCSEEGQPGADKDITKSVKPFNMSFHP